MLPLKDNIPTKTFPYVTIGLIVANFIVWFWELSRPGVDVHVFRDGFYASEYLRAWALESQLRSYLRERFGNAWFSRREAGSLLRELWAEGQKPTADELLREVTGEKLELAAVGDRIREALAAV